MATVAQMLARVIDLFGPAGTADPTKLYGRLMVSPNGNVLVGKTTDDATHDFQVQGNSQFTGTLGVSGNVTLSATAQRITGDYSNGTLASRVLFQTSAANSNTSVGAVPSGSGTGGNFTIFSTPDPTNSSYCQIGVTAGGWASLVAGAAGTGTLLPLSFNTGGALRWQITTSGQFMYTTTAAGLGGYVNALWQINTTNNTVRGCVQGHANGQGYGIVFVNGNEQATTTQACVFVNTSGSAVGSITASTSATAFNTTSDYRLKDNVVKLDRALDTVMKLRPVRYTFNHVPKEDRHLVHEGFIAHELQEYVPHAVHGKKDEVWHNLKLRKGHDPKNIKHEDVLDVEEEMVIQQVDYSKVVPLLTAALQEAITEIQSLKERVAELEAK
jgi:hypothetical protein